MPQGLRGIEAIHGQLSTRCEIVLPKPRMARCFQGCKTVFSETPALCLLVRWINSAFLGGQGCGR